MTAIVMIVLVLMLFGVFPAWNHSRKWGYGPSIGLVLIILLILMMSGRL
jgi:Protein of unknown function (DUF3309)